MTSSVSINGRIPTDPATALILLLALTSAIAQLDPDQAQALAAAGGIAELALIALRLTRGKR